MKKILDLLEQYVEWIALGLGALFLFFMIWTYGVQTPVTVLGIGPAPLRPGEVDPYILEGPGTQLDNAMKDTKVPDMPMQHFVEGFIADMSFSNAQPTALAMPFDAQVLPVKIQRGQGLKAVQQQAPIDHLPVLAAAEILNMSSGKSSLDLTAPAAIAAGAPAAAVAGAAPADPDAPAPVAAPIAPAGAAGAPVVPVVANADRNWVTVAYKIPMQGVVQAFRAANIPNWSFHTSILEIHLYRQEMLPNNQVGPTTLIAPLETQALQPFPAAGNRQQETDYLKWAVDHVTDLLQPPFPKVIVGDQWRVPGQAVSDVVKAPVAQVPLDPTKDYPLNVLQQYPTDQRKAYFSQHQAYKESLKPKRPGATPSRPGASAAATPPAVPDVAAAAPPAVVDPAVAAAAATAAAIAAFTIPPGDFDPSQVATDVSGWIHDDTVVSGHTYRYMVVYRVKNPIYLTNAAKNVALVNQFDIKSPDGIWGSPVSIATNTNFFVAANTRPGAPSIRIKVYKWQAGVERAHVFDVGPGDVIGGKDGEVDYSTGWTVVDLRPDPRNTDITSVLVMDPNGTIESRDYKSDQAKPEFKALDQQVSSAGGTEQIAGGK